MTSTYLAFDLGASSGRAILGTLGGDRLELREVHRFPTPVVETKEHLFWDIEALWTEVRQGLELALAEAPDLTSISVDSWAVDYVPLDDAGQPLRNPYAYRDIRTRGKMAQAFTAVPPEEIYRRTGIQFQEFNTVYQLLADVELEPELVASTALRLPIADYLLYRLSGKAAVERTMASTTQLMEIETGDWDTELMQRLRLPLTGWPEIVAPGTVLGPLAVEGLPPTPHVVASCSHDTAAAVVAAAARGRSWAYLSSGTWSLLGVELEKPILSDQARRANFTNEAGLDGTIRFLKNLTGLWVLQECQREWAEHPDGFLLEQTLKRAAALPRSPGVIDLEDPRFTRRGAMLDRVEDACVERGIRMPRTHAGVARLILESLAESYRAAVAELEEVTGREIEVIHLIGGGSRIAFLCRLTAERCGCEVHAGPVEATAIGNLLVQARAAGRLPPNTSIRDVVRASFAPRVYQPGGGPSQPARPARGSSRS